MKTLSEAPIGPILMAPLGTARHTSSSSSAFASIRWRVSVRRAAAFDPRVSEAGVSQAAGMVAEDLLRMHLDERDVAEGVVHLIEVIQEIVVAQDFAEV